MSTRYMMLREGDIVLALGHGNRTFKITQIFRTLKLSTIEPFGVLEQKFSRGLAPNVATDTLTRRVAS